MKNTLSILALFILLLFAGCAARPGSDIIPADLKPALETELSLDQVRQAPDRFTGKLVLWGGRIIKTINRTEETLIQVMQQPLDSKNRPEEVDRTQGRFLIRSSEYLDPFIYRSGREITVVGELVGTKTMPLGDMDYTYPVVRAENIRLWEPRQEKVRVYHEYPPFHRWYGPWPHHPYWW